MPCAIQAFAMQTPEVQAEAGGSWESFDPKKPNDMTKILWQAEHPTLHLTHVANL